jgi:hypothetical protein
MSWPRREISKRPAIPASLWADADPEPLAGVVRGPTGGDPGACASMSLDDLLERIARLSPELRGQLLNRLQELV